jgi:hypothetical protein
MRMDGQRSSRLIDPISRVRDAVIWLALVLAAVVAVTNHAAGSRPFAQPPVWATVIGFGIIVATVLVVLFNLRIAVDLVEPIDHSRDEPR